MRYYTNDELWSTFNKAAEIWSPKVKVGIEYTAEQAREIIHGIAISTNKIPAKGQFSSHFLIVFARHLRLQKMLEGKSVELPLKAVESLWAVIGNVYNFALNTDMVQKLLDVGIRIRETCEIPINDNLKYMAESALRLSKIVPGITVSKGTLEFDENLSDKIFRHLDDKMSRLGGLEFLAHYEGHSWLLKRYSAELDRYMICRQDFLGERQKPIHFLLNLAARHISVRPARQWEYQKNLHDEIIQTATDFLEVCDLQDTSGISYATMRLDELPYYFMNDLFLCKMCIPVQYSSKFILTALNHLIKPWFAEANLTYKYRDYYSVAEYFLGRNWWAEDKRFLSLSEIHDKTGVSTHKLKEILKDISISAHEVNKDFNDFNSPANFFDYPLFHDSNRGYCCFDRLLCGYGFLTRIQQLIKRNKNNLDSLQGYALEEWLHEEMRHKKYSVKFGSYPEQNGVAEGECDCVLDDESLCFIELKKKEVIKNFNNVDDVSLWKAIGQGMIRAQKQCFAHEFYLRTNGTITFSGGDSVNLAAKKLPALKISVCFGEYFYISGKAYVKALLEAIFSNRRLATTESDNQVALDDFNEYAQKLLEIVRRQNALTGEHIEPKELAGYSLFCSLQQILMAVWNTSGEKEFFDILAEWQYRLDGSLDQYIVLFSKLHQQYDSVSQAIMNFAKSRKNPCLVVS